jgi:hypothetical protein
MSQAPSQKRPNQVVVDLKELRPVWDAWCAKEGLTSSEALRRLVSRLEPSGTPEAPSGPRKPLNGSQRVSARPRLLLSDDEWRQVEELAVKDEISPARWIVSLIRAHLAGGPQLCWPEVERLNVISSNLNRVGTLLNTAVRQVNQIAADRERTKRTGGRLESVEDSFLRMTEMARERVERLFGELHRELVSTREGVRVALRANAERWTPKGSRVSRPPKEEVAP